MNRVHLPDCKQAMGLAEQFDRRLAATLVSDADASPGNGVPERFPRRLFGREKARQTFGPVALAHRVGHLRFGIDFPSEPLQRARFETVAIDLREVEADSDDHLR